MMQKSIKQRRILKDPVIDRRYDVRAAPPAEPPVQCYEKFCLRPTFSCSSKEADRAP